MSSDYGTELIVAHGPRDGNTFELTRHLGKYACGPSVLQSACLHLFRQRHHSVELGELIVGSCWCLRIETFELRMATPITNQIVRIDDRF